MKWLNKWINSLQYFDQNNLTLVILWQIKFCIVSHQHTQIHFSLFQKAPFIPEDPKKIHVIFFE